jgi:hypothetical protein
MTKNKDCRDCKKWNDCECGKKGHENGTSIGYSIGECKEFEVKAMPIGKLEEVKAELPDHSFWQDAGGEPLVAIRDVVEIIDRKVNELKPS